MTRQTKIPCVIQRGGTSKGPYFLASDLPSDPALRDRVLLAVMGSPDVRQIDGLGGADPLTSKVAIVSRSSTPGVDLDYLFCQVKVDQPMVDVTPNCGNMLAGVAPFALEHGLIDAADGRTTVRIHMVNSGNLCDAHIETPGGIVSYDGDARIDGAPGTSAPVMIDFLDTAGSACGSLLPTGNVVDEVDGVKITCIDNGMPVVLLKAQDVGATGYESRDELNAAEDVKKKIESIRLQIGEAMNLGDVTEKVVPKMCLVSPPAHGGTINTRCFIPHVCHASIGVLAAVTVGTACVLPGSTAYDIAEVPDGNPKLISVEHPSGEFSVELETGESVDGVPTIERAALLRTTRRLMEGFALVPADVWDGRTGLVAEAAE
ncbi:4-oxalomesaconate tautomerase [uncultured Demequina sp.]|uniref:4-oxalomesaconate tautomerase n=1 Tax=uncultured Demequina sp. TaxID=693499 RepID=UPI0025E28781|nr:4-oxalomesaconate tautomerase [uncultured Demequina sp.]